MKAVHDKIEVPFAIEEDLALYGMVIGSVTLRSGIKLILHGTIDGDLILETGERAIIHGTVAGRICNEGGRAGILGSVDGVEDISPDAVQVLDTDDNVRDRHGLVWGRG